VLETCRDFEYIYTKKELYVKLFIYKNYTEMHGQQNINFHKMLVIQLLFAINMCY